MGRQSLRLWCNSEKVLAKLRGALVHFLEKSLQCTEIARPLLSAELSNWRGLPGLEHSSGSHAEVDPKGFTASSLLNLYGYHMPDGNFINWPFGSYTSLM